MSTDAVRVAAPLSRFEQLRCAQDVLQQEAQALLSLAGRLDERFCEAADLCFACQGHVLVSGMGKAGLIGQKITATLASTGTRSHFLHPAEAFHGDLGRIHPQDVLLLMSFSGETEEVVRLLPTIHAMGNPLLAMTGQASSTLARHAHVVLDLGAITEAGALGLAPSTSTTAMLALGDALALVVSRMRGFQPEDFARFHPGGSLGRKLAKVEDLMRPLHECRVEQEASTVRDVFVSVSRPGRRTGAIMLTSADGKITGLFTDSDLARLLETRRDALIDGPIAQVMTQQPTTACQGMRLSEAIELLAEQRISELPVVDSNGRPVGMLDITDIIDAAVHAGESPANPSTIAFPAAPDANTSRPAP